MMTKTPKSKRETRVDAIRGLMLLMMFLDHITGNCLSLLTPRNMGFSDAAEVFVLLAGFSSNSAFGKYLQEGLLKGSKPIVVRIIILWVFHIVLFPVISGIHVLWGISCQLPPEHYHLVREGLNGFLRFMMLMWLPGGFDILPLYMVLLVLYPAVDLSFKRYGVGWTLLVSSLVWLIIGFAIRWNFRTPARRPVVL